MLRKISFLLICMPLFLYAQEEAKLREKYLAFSDINQWDSALVYTFKVKDAAARESGKNSMQYFRALNNIGYVYLNGQNNVDSAQYWWTTAMRDIEKINDPALQLSKTILAQNLVVIYLTFKPSKDSAVYYAGAYLRAIENSPTPTTINKLVSHAVDIETRFGMPFAKPLYRSALELRSRASGQAIARIIAGIDSILSSSPVTNTPGRRRRLYSMLADAPGIDSLQQLSAEALNEVTTWKAIEYAGALMDAALRHDPKHPAFITGLRNMGLAYRRWLNEDPVALYCLKNAVAILRERKQTETPVYKTLLQDIAEIEKKPGQVFAIRQKLPDSKKFINVQKSPSINENLRLMLPIGHSYGVRDARFSPDEKYVVSRSFNSTSAKVWDVATGSLLHNLDLDAPVYHTAVSRDSRLVLTGSDTRIGIWDLENGSPLWNYRLPDTLTAYLFSATGDQLFIAEGAYLNTFRAADGTLLKREKFKGKVRWLHYRDNNTLMINIVTPSGNHSLYVYHLTTGVVQPFISKEYFNATVSGKTMAVIYGSDLVTYDMETLGVVNIIDLEQPEPNGYSLSTDGQRLVVSNPTDTSRVVYNARSGEVLSHYNWKTLTTDVELLPGGERYIARYPYNMFATVYNTDNQVMREELMGDTLSVSYNVANFLSFSNSGKYMLLVFEDNIIRMFDVSGEKLVPVREFSGKTRPLSRAVLLDDQTLAVGSAEQRVKLIDLSTGTVTSNPAQFKLLNINLTLDKKQLITRSFDTVIVWKYPLLEKISTYPVERFALHNDIKESDYQWLTPELVAQKSIARFSWESNAAEMLVKGDSVVFVQFNKDRSKALIGAYRKGFGVFDLKTRKFEVLVRQEDWLFRADYTRDFKYIITQSLKMLSVYESAGGRLINQFPIRNKTGAMKYTITKDGKAIISGDESGLLKIWEIGSGRLLKTAKVHTSGFEPFLTTDNERLITVSEEGTIKVWHFSTMDLLYTFVPSQGDDNLIHTPSGYYKSSREAARSLHYVTKTNNIIGFDQLDVKYNRPDKVLKLMGNRDSILINSYRLAYEKRIRKLGIDTGAFRAGFVLPAADFANRPGIPAEQRQENLKLHIVASDDSTGLHNFNVWVNDSPVFGIKGIDLRSRLSKQFDTTLTIRLSAGKNRIETSVTNANGGESYRKPLLVNYVPVQAVSAKTWFVGIGVSKFADSTRNLRWSTADIINLDNAFRTRYGKQYRSRLLLDKEVTPEQISTLKTLLRDSTGVNDRVIIAYSGHGVVSKDFEYYLSTHRLDFNRPEKEGISYDALEGLLDGIAARKKLLLIDACNSGEIDKEEVRIAKGPASKSGGKGVEFIEYGSKSTFELMQEIFINVNRGTGATVISASNGTQPAYEKNDLKGGVFTYAILQKLKDKEETKISSLIKHLTKWVPEITKGAQRPTIRGAGTADDWGL